MQNSNELVWFNLTACHLLSCTFTKGKMQSKWSGSEHFILASFFKFWAEALQKNGSQNEMHVFNEFALSKAEEEELHLEVRLRIRCGYHARRSHFLPHYHYHRPAELAILFRRHSWAAQLWNESGRRQRADIGKSVDLPCPPGQTFTSICAVRPSSRPISGKTKKGPRSTRSMGIISRLNWKGSLSPTRHLSFALKEFVGHRPSLKILCLRSRRAKKGGDATNLFHCQRWWQENEMRRISGPNCKQTADEWLH